MRWKTWAIASALALTSINAAPAPAFAQAHTTQLSQCMRNGLIGAGVGALAGALATHGHHRTRNAIAGAAVGGVGTWAVCRMLTQREQSRVENNYQSALNRNRAVNDQWSSGAGDRTLYVARPQAAPDAGAGCKTVTAHVNDPQNGRQELPPETFCRNGQGQWVPV